MNQHLTLVEKTCNEIVIGIPEDLETTFRQEECIYKAPAAIRKLNGPAYTPQVISIGPFHHDSENLQPMEIQKQRYLKEFCKRLGWQSKEQVHKSLKELLSIIEDREGDIRRRYAAEIKSKRFLKMILLDAVFIFELFLKSEEYSGDRNKYKDDFIIGKPWLRAAIQRDLILLENQLPFFILEELYKHATSTSYCMATYTPFLDLSGHYFENYGKNRTLPGETKHFTDLVRYFLSFKHPTLDPPDKKQRKQHFTERVRNYLRFKDRKLEPQIKNPYSATMLHQAGIKFKANLQAECLLDIRAWDDDNENPVKKGELHMPQLEIRAWDDNEKPAAIKKGELHMPQLEIDNCTECLFRNLMALEQCHYPGEEFICRYVKLLDFLVDVEKDVDLLIENKVIVCRLGDSKSVAKLINKLCLEIVEVTSGYDALSDQLNNYYDSSWNKNKAYLVSVYFENVWIGTGTVIGLIILAITVARFILFFFRR